MYVIMRVRLFVFCVVMTVLLGGLGGQVSYAQFEQGEYFSQTGHWVPREILDVYNQSTQPEILYGDPISSFFESSPNLYVQYFQKVRFEIHLDRQPGQRVELTDLGRVMYQFGAGAPVAENSTNCREFPDQGFRVCQAFLEFFDAHGGVAQFGYPISNVEVQDNIIVQNFEKARFEWHPHLPINDRVQLSDLGTGYFYMIGENRVYLRPEDPGDAINDQVSALKVRAYPKYAVVESGQNQTIYVIVQDQKRLPVDNARVNLRLQFSGEERQVSIQEQTRGGTTQLEFTINTASLGVVQIHVTAEYEDLSAKTVTSFRIWR